MIHIDISRRFYNGKVLEILDDEVVKFDDRKLGVIHIFINDIKKIDEYDETTKTTNLS